MGLHRYYGVVVVSLAGFLTLFSSIVPRVSWQLSGSPGPPLAIAEDAIPLLNGYYLSEEALSRRLPNRVEVSEPFRVRVHRSDGFQPELLHLAEAIFPPREAVLLAVPEFYSMRFGLPQVAELWWTSDFEGIHIPFALTSSSVRYYLGLSEIFRTDAGRSPTSVPVWRSSLEYEATIQRHNRYVYGARVFEDVFVARMDLSWSMRCGGSECGLWFDKSRIVVFSAGGEVLAIFGDENTPTRIS